MDKVKNLDDWGRFKIDSYSLLVDSPHFSEMIEKAKGLDVGLHLSLTYPWITFRQFIFYYFFKDLFTEQYIYNEWDRQIQKFLKTGLPLERVDSHHGVHFFPSCWKILMTLMKKYDIKYVRNPPRKLYWFHWNLRIWISHNKSWLFYKINKYKPGIKPLPYEEAIWHLKS